MDTAPQPLTERITTALDLLRAAQKAGDLIAEWFWDDILDRLLVSYAQGDR